ncbi:hypothetical protein TELCIR_09263 [Teladorsagia circumcincta]|uniref:Transposase Tc1-like domain-containing protein n=1 Tax=Teladorsagia circumcincta TaxID=45464 RepID=A0A2G9UFD2_TELCI|nr:hypothetical protein TELCIR_09263 [Teladorsagia circumcincta]
MGIKRTTVDSIIKVYTKEGRVQQKRRGGVRGQKLTEEQIQLITSWVDDDCSITLKKIQEKCADTFGIAVSQSTINRALAAFSYTVTVYFIFIH